MDLRALARIGYPEFGPAQQEELARRAFLRGVRPWRLREHIRLAAPASLAEALREAERAEPAEPIMAERHAPVRLHPRRLPLAKRAIAEQTLREMADSGVIEPASGPWSSPVVLVRKKDESWRFCVDYRRLNEVTRKDSYPLPRIDDALEHVAGSAWFSSLDLRSGYWQVELAPEARPKTAFSIGQGLWQFRRMPFGLCNAPATFERLMEKVLADIPRNRCVVYLDDLLVHGKEFEVALANLREVFLAIRRANLRLNPKKCQLLRQETVFLGHVISAQGIATDPAKIAAVQNWPEPVNVSQLRTFLGLASYYRRFVKNFATIASPLHELTRKNQPFRWDWVHARAFTQLREALVTSPVLEYPDASRMFILDTDASDLDCEQLIAEQEKDPALQQVLGWVKAGRRPEYNAVAHLGLEGVDILGPFPVSDRGNRYVLVAMDYFTKWPEAFAVPDQSASTTARVLVDEVFSRFGAPERLHSDQGRNFEAEVFAAVCERLGVKKTRTTPLHPQSDGLVERFNRTLTTQLAVLTSARQKDWDEHLPLVLWAYRTAVQESSQLTPAALMFGRELRTPVDLVFGPPPQIVWLLKRGEGLWRSLQLNRDQQLMISANHYATVKKTPCTPPPLVDIEEDVLPPPLGFKDIWPAPQLNIEDVELPPPPLEDATLPPPLLDIRDITLASPLPLLEYEDVALFSLNPRFEDVMPTPLLDVTLLPPQPGAEYVVFAPQPDPADVVPAGRPNASHITLLQRHRPGAVSADVGLWGSGYAGSEQTTNILLETGVPRNINGGGLKHRPPGGAMEKAFLRRNSTSLSPGGASPTSWVHEPQDFLFEKMTVRRSGLFKRDCEEQRVPPQSTRG
ncbi:uncharacterized protein LOC128520866 [Clarias gariepinus]|uniref:uncharacterized protein LOC128520866 n=1 Tax=Clarias gariepinus TaxID=13013 RepID=UPI00234E3605|nr:uncharacterized protein LOC128520866 [Clarias gariepinus]